MNKTTFIELYLVKHGQIIQEDAENIVKQFSDLYPEKNIFGVLGYIKYCQIHYHPNEGTAKYILKDMQEAIQKKNSGKQCIPSTQSYWVEMENDRMPKL
jgi:hypothetical protein